MERRYRVANMRCGGCVARIEEVLRNVPAVKAVECDLAAKSVRVAGDVEPAAVQEVLDDAGYPAAPLSEDTTGGDA